MTLDVKNLQAAKKNKNDEFYTQLSDIEKELCHYTDHFKDKVIYCNCDDPSKSNFFKYFKLNFEFLGLKKLISTHYETDKPSYKLEITKDVNGDGKINKLNTLKMRLKQNGDFRNTECVKILQEADVVVTNPPFSLFREYVALIVEHDKKFLIIGNKNAISYKEIFKLIKEKKLWLGNSLPQKFITTGEKIQKSVGAFWFTNLDFVKRHEDIILYKKYNEVDYPKYDNYDAINVDKTKDIPCDYFGYMGVPISFLYKYNPDQFEIINIDRVLTYANYGKASRFFINNKEKYARIIIKNKRLQGK